MTQIAARDGSMRWRVFFSGEIRDVWARSGEAAVRTAEHAQRITNAPETARKAFRLARVGLGPDGRPIAFDVQQPMPLRDAT